MGFISIYARDRCLVGLCKLNRDVDNFSLFHCIHGLNLSVLAHANAFSFYKTDTSRFSGGWRGRRICVNKG